MADKEEIIRTTTPGPNIQCRTCKHKLPPVEVMGEKIPRYSYGACYAFANKPMGVLLRGEKCELYSEE